jgi:tetratricopeptide (TPR) repeat protein
LRNELGSVDAVWYDSRGETPDGIGWDGGIRPAAYWEQNIFHELRIRPVFVVLLSPNAVASPWVQDEILLAWKQKNERGRRTPKVIVPVIVPDARDLPLPEPLDLIQTVSFVERPPVWTQEQAFQALLVAIRSDHTQLRPGEGEPPFEVAELPLPEHFIGRDDDLEWVLNRLQPGATAGITALRGLGGIGKTALAAKVVQQVFEDARFPGGIVVQDCRDLSNPVTVLKRVLASFDPDRRELESGNLKALSEVAQKRLSGRRVLIVLDNVEPELDIAAVLQRLHPAGAAILLTAREVLPLPPDTTLHLELLPTPAALDLFSLWYRGSSAEALSSTEPALGTRIVTALGRHTLAIKLAGAEAGDLQRPLESFTLEVEAHPLIIQGADATLALKGNLMRSVTKLPTAGELGNVRQLFAALAAFVTPVEIEDAEGVTFVPSLDMGRQAVIAVAAGLGLPAPERAVDLLVRRALVDATTERAMPDGSDRERVRLHPLLRELAAELLDDPTQEAAALAIATFYAEYADATLDTAVGVDAGSITGALEWAQASAPEEVRTTLVAAICSGMAPYWRHRWQTRASLRYLPWGIAAAETSAERSQARDDLIRAASLSLSYGRVLRRTGQLAQAEALYKQNLQLSQQMQDRKGEGEIRYNLGRVAQQRGRWEDAEDYFQQSLAIRREVQDRKGEGMILSSLGRIAWQQSRLEEAEAAYKQSLVICLEVQDRQGEGVVLSGLGRIAAQRGQFAEAEGYFHQSLAIYREMHDRRGEGVNLARLGLIAERHAAWEQAEESMRQGLEMVRQAQDAIYVASIAQDLGRLLIEHRDKSKEGCALLREAARIYESMGLDERAEETRTLAASLGCEG